jgi:hypothetical protein
VLDVDAVDVDDIATALADQTDYDHGWLTNPDTGEVVFWTSDTGIDGENPADIDELDLVMIEPLPPTSGIATWSTSPKASATTLWVAG